MKLTSTLWSICGGSGNIIYHRTGDGDSNYSFIGSGYQNEIGADDEATGTCNYTFIGGGYQNKILCISGSDSSHSGVASGASNLVSSSDYSFIGGGQSNSIVNASNDFIGAGYSNLIDNYLSSSSYNSIVGGYNNSIESDSVYGLYTAYYSFVGGGKDNTINGSLSNAGYSSIVGGEANEIESEYSFVGSGKLGKASWYGQQVHASGSFTSSAGTAQVSEVILWREITASGTHTLYLDGSSEELTTEADTIYSIELSGLITQQNTGYIGRYSGSAVITCYTGGTLNIDTQSITEDYDSFYQGISLSVSVASGNSIRVQITNNDANGVDTIRAVVSLKIIEIHGDFPV
jgi:hypothetical protein